jgi:hypothetical protein
MRKRRTYSQDTAWRWLRRHPGSPASALAEALRLTPNAAGNILKRLRDGGHARMGYLDHRKADRYVVWYAVGTAPPSNRSGCAPSSLLNLQAQWGRWEENLRLAWAACGQDYPKPRVTSHPEVDSHPLAKAWRRAR